MKITDLKVQKEAMANGEIGLAFRATLSDGKQIGAAVPWRNKGGMWGSDSDERDPAEIAAILRSFAKAIEDAAKVSKAA